MQAILEVLDLVKQYEGVRAVDGLSLAIAPGRCVGLLGPNGAGKTTTVEIMEGIKSADRGEVFYKGSPLDARFRQEAGIMFQSTALQEFITVGETLRMFRRFYDRGFSLNKLIDNFSLGSLLRKDTRKLSGGQKQRVLLAIALINDPEIVFLDEPSTGLDPQARRNIWGIIQDIKARGKTILLTTHYMDEAYELCDEIAIMDRGRIIAQGSPDELLAEHFDDVVIQLPAADAQAHLAGLDIPVLRQRDQVHIVTHDVASTLDRLMGLGIPLQHLRIRSRNLEDLFLELTGKELRA